jgi:hypothetical protein
LTKRSGALCPASLTRSLTTWLALRRSSAFGLVLAGAVLALAIAWQPTVASAQDTRALLAVDGAYSLPLRAGYAAPGEAFGLRLGSMMSVPGLYEVLELGFNYAQFAPAAGSVVADNFKTYRGVVGARLGGTGVLRPGLLAHLGLGHVSGTIGKGAGTGDDLSHTGFTWDAGVYLDLAIASIFQLGLQASYNQIVATTGGRAFQTAELGGHLAIEF